MGSLPFMEGVHSYVLLLDSDNCRGAGGLLHQCSLCFEKLVSNKDELISNCFWFLSFLKKPFLKEETEHQGRPELYYSEYLGKKGHCTCCFYARVRLRLPPSKVPFLNNSSKKNFFLFLRVKIP